MKNEVNVTERVNGQNKIYFMTECAIFAAIICIFSPIAIPIGPIPITLGVFAIMLTGIVLGWKKGVLSVLVYILIGLCGVPIFSGGKSGLTALAGPTGGYIWSYLIMVMVIGILCQKEFKNQFLSMVITVLSCMLGIIVIYLFGTFQFTLVAEYSWKEALAVCVYPFIPFDLIKALCASILGVNLRKRLKKAGYLQ